MARRTQGSRGCVYEDLRVIFTAEMNQNHVSFGGLESDDSIILEYSGPWSLEAEVASKGARRWKDLLKCHCAVGALNFAEHEAFKLKDYKTPTRRGLLFAVVAD